MTNLIETPVYEAGIYQLEITDPYLGGQPAIVSGVPVDGHANAQGLQLANRTAYLKQKVDELSTTLENVVCVTNKGAIGDGSTDNTLAIQSAIDEIAAMGGGYVDFSVGGVYITQLLTQPNNVVLRAKFGDVTLKLKNGSNTALLESLGFDSLYITANTPGTDVFDLPYDFGFDGLLLDGNKDNQTVSGIPLVKYYGARLHLNGQICNSKGPALHTACFGAHSQSRKTPGNMRELEIFNCEEEGWIFEGPSDQYFGHLVMSVIGDQSNDGTIPQTSTMYPGEPVHGLRFQSGSMHMASMNINGVRFGRGVYANGRCKFGDVIAAGCWGNILFTSSAVGSVSSIHVQANPYNWAGVVYPNLENNSDDVQFANVTALRVTGQDQMTAPLVVDNGGGQWGNVRNRQALVQGGVFFVSTASTTTIANLDIKGADVGLRTTTTCKNISLNCSFNNVNTVWVNESAGVKGSWDFTGSLETGQVFATGLDASPTAEVSSLSAARINFTLNGVAKVNKFMASASFDATTTNGQTISFNHNMWRTPKVEDINFVARISGWTVEPAGLCLAINSFNSTTVSARVKLITAATGTPTAQVICTIG